eukprot:6662362-Pyramimonas_sp.AAC.1
MYTAGSRIHQNSRFCANVCAGSEKASVYRVRFPAKNMCPTLVTPDGRRILPGTYRGPGNRNLHAGG